MTLNSILAVKEERYIRQKKFVEKYKLPIISFTLNIPGKQKTEDDFVSLHKEVRVLIKKKLIKQNIDVIYEEALINILGPECIMVVNGLPQKVKEIMIDLEEKFSLGRLLDLDVFDEQFKLISRRDLGYKGRLCFLCSEEAVKCMIKGTHSREELRKKIETMIKAYKEELSDEKQKRDSTSDRKYCP